MKQFKNIFECIIRDNNLNKRVERWIILQKKAIRDTGKISAIL